MGHNNVVKNSVIRNKTGAIVHIGTDGDNDKYFAVIAKCGHVGNGYFIPICFAIMAKDLDSAIQLTKEHSRVQRNHKDCILAALEISSPEYYLINFHNDRDPYLCTDYSNKEYYYIERRRIISPELLQEVFNGKPYYINKVSGIELRVPVIEEVKTADKYLDYQTLQRAYSPQKYGDKYIYLKHINQRELLDRYLGEIAVLQGILKNRAQPLVWYYQIFGEGNELGLTYQYGELKYRSLNNKIVYVPVSDIERGYVESSAFIRAPKQHQALEYDDIGDYVPIVSAKERFNKRLQKHKQLSEERFKNTQFEQE